MPWFVGFFLLASVLRSYVPGVAHAATVGLTLTPVFDRGRASARTLRNVGWRPLLQGVILWIFISVVSLGIIRRFV